MRIFVRHNAEQSLACLEVHGALTGGLDGEAISAHLRQALSYDADNILVDYSGLSGDVVLEDVLAFLEGSGELIEQLKTVKIAAVLHEKLKNTSILLAMLFAMGVWIAVFKDGDQALDWLLRSEDRPRWLRNGA
jgi:hypothetical protein